MELLFNLHIGESTAINPLHIVSRAGLIYISKSNISFLSKQEYVSVVSWLIAVSVIGAVKSIVTCHRLFQIEIVKFSQLVYIF